MYERGLRENPIEYTSNKQLQLLYVCSINNMLVKDFYN